MKKIVFFLGAGASKPFGIPLTKEILPEILISIENNDLFCEIDGGDFTDAQRKSMEKDLGNFLYRLMPGLKNIFEKYKNKKADIDGFPLITDILSIVDHSDEYGNNLMDGNKKETGYYRKLLDRAIYEILADPITKDNSFLSAFSEHIDKLIKKDNEVTIITTNYDATLEYRIFSDIKDPKYIDFGFSWREVTSDEIIHYQPQSPKLRIYKLHGSLNWLKCNLCDHLYINPAGNIIHQSFRTGIDDYNTCHCGNAPLKSVIVAPSLVREVKEPNLLHVWKSSIQALRKADKWIIIGYSLPPEDLAIKSLLIRGKNAKDDDLNANDLIIVQKTNSTTPPISYSLLFGENNFKFISNGLEEYLSKTRKNEIQL